MLFGVRVKPLFHEHNAGGAQCQSVERVQRGAEKKDIFIRETDEAQGKRARNPEQERNRLPVPHDQENQTQHAQRREGEEHRAEEEAALRGRAAKQGVGNDGDHRAHPEPLQIAPLIPCVAEPFPDQIGEDGERQPPQRAQPEILLVVSQRPYRPEGEAQMIGQHADHGDQLQYRCCHGLPLNPSVRCP